MPWSMTLTIACSTDGNIRVAPGVPSAMNGLPSFITIVGAMLLTMRLPGAIEFALPG